MKKVVHAVVVFFISLTNCYSQNIDSTIEKYATNYSEERTYLHYDKSTYSAGETIWYTAYIMSDIYPADASKTFYADISDDKGKLLEHTVIPVVYATAAGEFDIPAAFTGKYIHIKAYTKWMLNFDSSFLYNKDIRILAKTPAGNVFTKNAAVASIQFFPEGGDIINGVVNKVAFKANDQYGRPIKVKGAILNNHGEKTDSIHVVHDGMGYFYVFPKDGDSFSAKWKDEKGTEHITALPAVKPTGVALQVTLAGAKRDFRIVTPMTEATGLGTLHLIGTMYQHEVFKFSKDISQGVLEGSIPASSLPNGILTITVFDNSWKPLAERITYINNHEYLFNAVTNVEHWGLNKRARNEVAITVPDSLPANFSVAVTDIGIDADSSDNIISHLMLTGDLKGQVYNPAYYFKNDDDTLARQLDLVMLTHGWRSFKWNDVAEGKLPKINYPRDSSYLTLSGKVYGGTSSQYRNAGNMVLIVNQNKGNKMDVVQIHPDGTFTDSALVLFDSAHVYFKMPASKGLDDASVKFMENRLPPLANSVAATSIFSNNTFDTTGNARHYQLAKEMADELNFSSAKVLQTVTVTGKTKSPVQILDEKYTSGMFSGGDAYQFDLLDDPRAATSFNIFNYLQGQVAGLQVNTSTTPPTLTWRGGTPELFLDESSADANVIGGIPVTDVAYIKVLRPPFMGSSGGANGAIAIYTRRGGDRKPEPGKGLSNNLVTGYNVIKQFYSPNYETFNDNNAKRDLRSTLYWNPQIITTRANNKALFSFYNNDVSGAFRIVIEGMSSDGRLVHIETTME